MSAPTTTAAVSASAKRSWRRFTLRALFLVVLAAGIFFGWLAYRVRQFHDQARFIVDLRSRGFRVETERLNRFAAFWEALVGDEAVQVCTADLRGLDTATKRRFGPTSDDIRRLRTWTSVRFLSLFGPQVTDDSLTSIRALRDLETLALEDTAVSDTGLAKLADLTNLTSLYISAPDAVRCDDAKSLNSTGWGTPNGITDRGIASLSKLTTLTLLEIGPAQITDESMRVIAENHRGLLHLSLIRADITDSGMEYISDLPALVVLHLWNCRRISDTGLFHLHRLKSLTDLRLRGSNVSRKGIETLKTAMPHLDMHVDSVDGPLSASGASLP